MRSAGQPAAPAACPHMLQYNFQPLQYFFLTQLAAIVFCLLCPDERTGPLSNGYRRPYKHKPRIHKSCSEEREREERHRHWRRDFIVWRTGEWRAIELDGGSRNPQRIEGGGRSGAPGEREKELEW